MNAPAKDAAEQPESSRDIGAGLRLRQAREAAHRSISDVAEALHLDARTIEALEADDFEHLPAPAFVRGYLRSYARFLGLPPGPILEAYDRNEFAPPTLIADISDKPETHSGDFPVRVVTNLVVGGLVILMVLWWQSQNFYPDFGVGFGENEETSVAGEMPAPDASAIELLSTETPLPPIEPAPPMAEAVSVPDTATVPADSDSPLPPPADPVPIDEEAASGVAAAIVVDPATDAPVDSTASDAEPVVEPAAESSAPASETAEALAADASNEPATAPPVAESLPAAPATADLRLEFTRESWVEIYDRSGARLFFGLVKPGREIEVAGDTPLDILLGVPGGVTLFYRGSRFDFSPFISRGIARFKLTDGPSGAPLATGNQPEPEAE